MNISVLSKELSYQATKSSGPGGQHVNKVATQVQVFFDVVNSKALNEEERALVLSKLDNKINKEGQLVISCSESRSQYRNKEMGRLKMISLIQSSLIKPKTRKPSRRTKASILKRLQQKRKNAEKKSNRRPPKNF